MENWDSLREALNTIEWPADYKFKFIAPIDSVQELVDTFPQQKLVHKPSSKGNYVSITFTRKMASAEEVISWYQRVAHIKGLISL